MIKSLSYIGLTKNLRKTPEERIEKAKLEMQLKYAQDKAIHLPDAEEILAKMQHEYEVLMHKMSEFYATKKRLMNMKKKDLQKSYESFELDFKCKELKKTLDVQKQKWRAIYAFYFELRTA
jgi:stearoyl-CoA desaturase (delta-9 desaturase)